MLNYGSVKIAGLPRVLASPSKISEVLTSLMRGRRQGIHGEIAGLARRAGLSRPTLYAAARGRPISQRTLVRLSFALKSHGILVDSVSEQITPIPCEIYKPSQSQPATVLQVIVQQMLRRFAKSGVDDCES